MDGKTSAKIGWIGLGSMGLGMAKNLQRHLKETGQPSLQYTNRTIWRGESLKDLGGIPNESVAQVVQNSEIIFSSISDDAALDSIVAGIIESGDISGKIIVDTSTVHPDTSTAASAELSKAGALFVAAPVFGASPVAEKGQVLFVVAGPAAATETISPYLKGVMGRAVISLGEDVSKSSLLKTSGNFITAAMMEIISEAHVFAEKTGLGSQALETLIELQYGPLAHTMSRRLTTGVYMPARGEKPWSDLNLALKDVTHGVECAQNAGAQLKVADVALSNLQRAKAYANTHGGRSLDSSSMYGILRKDSGLDFETELVKERDAAQSHAN